MARIFPYLLLAAILLMSVYGQLMLKSRAVVHSAARASGNAAYLWAMFTDGLVLSALASAAVAAALWMLAIQRLDLGHAYVFMALSFVLVPLGSALVFREPVHLQQVAGIALIVAGVSLYTLSR